VKTYEPGKVEMSEIGYSLIKKYGHQFPCVRQDGGRVSFQHPGGGYKEVESKDALEFADDIRKVVEEAERERNLLKRPSPFRAYKREGDWYVTVGEKVIWKTECELEAIERLLDLNRQFFSWLDEYLAAERC
jgi:hypothetical protein